MLAGVSVFARVAFLVFGVSFLGGAAGLAHRLLQGSQARRLSLVFLLVGVCGFLRILLRLTLPAAA